MARWRYCVVLAMLLLWPLLTDALDDEEDDGPEDNDDNDPTNDDDEDEPEEQPDKTERAPPGRRAPSSAATTTKSAATRTTKRPLDCFVCTYKSDSPARSCLDPNKYRVHTMTCHSTEDKCFTTVVAKGGAFESVTRGCRTGCLGSPDTTCCELNRCNNQPLSIPLAPAARLRATNRAKTLQPTVVLFVTVLLLLQTVVKVSFV